MFKFYYDCIGRFDDRKDFQYVEMDTDAPLQTVPNQEWRGNFGTSMGDGFLEVCARLTTQTFSNVWWVVGHGSRVTAVNKSWNMTWGYGGCSRRNKKVQELLLSTHQWLISVGTLVKNTSKASSKGISKRLNVLTADVYKGVPERERISRRWWHMRGEPTITPKDRSLRMGFLHPLSTSP